MFSTNSDSSQLHQGSVATGSLGAVEGPKLNSKQRTPNEADTNILPCTGPEGKVNESTLSDDTGNSQANACSSNDLCKSITIREPKNRRLYHQGSTKRARQTSHVSVPLGETGHVCPPVKLTSGDIVKHKHCINSTPFRSDTGGDSSLTPQSSDSAD